jgi:asparagine N-glycosylation enzyme membrane subunit Stt3
MRFKNVFFCTGVANLKALLNSAVDLCLLRSAPQDLPASNFLLWLLILLNLLVGTGMVLDARLGIFRAVLENLFGLALLLGVLAAALGSRGRLPRFNQTANATLLSGLLLSLLALPLVVWRHRSESIESELLLLVLFVWSIAVLGHILRHAFEVSLNLGIGFALLYTLMAWSIMSHLFPVAT